MASMVVFTCEVPYDRVVKLVEHGYGLAVQEWDDLVLDYWAATGWSIEDATQEVPPPSILAYEFTTKEILSLGAYPTSPGPHIVFLWPDMYWAIACSTSPLHRPRGGESTVRA
jgi:hypothetical protein